MRARRQGCRASATGNASRLRHHTAPVPARGGATGREEAGGATHHVLDRPRAPALRRRSAPASASWRGSCASAPASCRWSGPNRCAARRGGRAPRGRGAGRCRARGSTRWSGRCGSMRRWPRPGFRGGLRRRDLPPGTRVVVADGRVAEPMDVCSSSVCPSMSTPRARGRCGGAGDRAEASGGDRVGARAAALATIEALTRVLSRAGDGGEAAALPDGVATGAA